MLSRLRALAESIDSLAALRLTLLLLLLRPPGDPALHGATWLLAGAALVVPRLTASRWMWCALTAAVAARLVVGWPLPDNHIYLLAYWCLAVALALGTSAPFATLARASRWLVATTFSCAVIWKAVVAPDFLDARFFRITLVTDPRFACVAERVGGLSPGQLAENREALAPMPTGVELLDGPVLVEPAALRVLARALTWGGLLLEVVVALAFLSPAAWAVARLRHPALLLFIVGTYAIAPVAGFGWLLAAMGLSQVDDQRARLRLAYVAAAGAVLIYAETPLVDWLLGCGQG
jgi:hypothetical protein